jgi:hypothetical protein
MTYGFKYLEPIIEKININIKDIYEYFSEGLEDDEDINEVFDNDFDMMMYDLYNIDIDDYLDIDLRIEIEKEWNEFIQNKL